MKNVVSKAENIDKLSSFSNPVLCDNLEGWNGVGGGSKVWEGRDICKPIAESCWLWQKLTQYCQATILQTKKKNIQFHCNPGKFKNIIIISIKIITVNVF